MKIKWFNIVLLSLILLPTLTAIQSVSFSDVLKYVVVNTYSMYSRFINVPFQIGNATTIINGSISGVYVAKFYFYSGETIVEISYINYTLNGFDEEVIKTIKLHLERKEKHVVKHKDPPYKCMLTGNVSWVTPYHYPPNLLIEAGADPGGEFSFECVYREGLAYEKHYYRHDLNTGILIELRVSIRFQLVETNVTGYRWFTVKLVKSNTPVVIINQKSWLLNERYFVLTAFTPLIVCLILIKRRCVKGIN